MKYYVLCVLGLNKNLADELSLASGRIKFFGACIALNRRFLNPIVVLATTYTLSLPKFITCFTMESQWVSTAPGRFSSLTYPNQATVPTITQLLDNSDFGPMPLLASVQDSIKGNLSGLMVSDIRILIWKI